MTKIPPQYPATYIHDELSKFPSYSKNMDNGDYIKQVINMAYAEAIKEQLLNNYKLWKLGKTFEHNEVLCSKYRYTISCNN